MSVVLHVAGISKRYGHVEALRNINLQVERGIIQGIIGFSGAGKSTLLRCLTRLEKPDCGHVLISGRDLAELEGASLREALHNIGVVFQSLNLLRSRTVVENVALPLRLTKVDAAAVKARVIELLDWFGLSSKANHYPAQLSGGQRQRVAIARALALSPALLLTDEPTSALDPETAANVLQLLRRVRDEFNVTIVISTHQLDAVRAICDRVAVLEAGQIVEEGAVNRVLSQPQASATKRLLISPSELIPCSS